MLKLFVPGVERFDEKTEMFIPSKDATLILEHSLLSLSKWESKWQHPFPYFDPTRKQTREESIDYVRCMTINQKVDPFVYYNITPDLFQKINEYISNPMTATTINRKNKRLGGMPKEIITSELIYFWMTSYGIPFECEKWHLNRLLTLIDVCSFKNETPQKMSQRDLMRRNTALNNARRAKHHTRG